MVCWLSGLYLTSVQKCELLDDEPLANLIGRNALLDDEDCALDCCSGGGAGTGAGAGCELGADLPHFAHPHGAGAQQPVPGGYGG